jgi:hypothetical protein
VGRKGDCKDEASADKKGRKDRAAGEALWVMFAAEAILSLFVYVCGHRCHILCQGRSGREKQAEKDRHERRFRAASQLASPPPYCASLLSCSSQFLSSLEGPAIFAWGR